MQPCEFAEHHRPALELDEIRHNLILALLSRLADNPHMRRWTLGGPGACATQTPGYPIVLGEVTPAQCRALAEETRDLDYPGVVGTDRTAEWFVECAIELGVAFLDPIPQQIQGLREEPKYPGAPGRARIVVSDDVAIFSEWMIAFQREAVPHEPPPSREWTDKMTAEGRYQFWIVDGEPVSMAGIARHTRQTAAIAPVYTPPPLRGRGYGGSITAAVVERIFAEGKTAACLYTDLRNACSNRCYAKVGFKPVYQSWHYLRA